MTLPTECRQQHHNTYEPCHEKTNVLVSDLDFRFRKLRDCTIYVAKTKALISFAVTAKLICVFVFAYAKHWFSHDAAHINTLV